MTIIITYFMAYLGAITGCLFAFKFIFKQPEKENAPISRYELPEAPPEPVRPKKQRMTADDYAIKRDIERAKESKVD